MVLWFAGLVKGTMVAALCLAGLAIERILWATTVLFLSDAVMAELSVAVMKCVGS
jgi:hypothetical protein